MDDINSMKDDVRELNETIKVIAAQLILAGSCWLACCPLTFPWPQSMEKEVAQERREADGALKLAKLSQVAKQEHQPGLANTDDVRFD